MTNSPPTRGLHHVTALTADGQKNIDFYTGVLGLRLAKVTVNFDDPRSYHLYYGNETGSPGSAITFFVWPGVRTGRHGAGQVTATAFSVPAASMTFWRTRLQDFGVTYSHEAPRFSAEVIAATDPDGLRFELVGDADDSRTPWRNGPVDAQHAIRGFHSVTITAIDDKPTAAMLTAMLGFRAIDEDGDRLRFASGNEPGGFVDVLRSPDAQRGSYGAGIVHHVAFRTPDDATQTMLRAALLANEFKVSPVMERLYFRSIYFREPGGVLFEVATEQPGFTADEPAAALGTSLRLPPQHEPNRMAIEAALPKLKLPSGDIVP